MLIDAHCHLEPELDAHALVDAMDDAGVNLAVVFAAAHAPVTFPSIGPRIHRACMSFRPLRLPMYRLAVNSRRLKPYERPRNAPVFEVARAHPERFIPFVFLNPTLGDAAHDEFDRGVAAGVQGVKLHAYFHGYRLTDALPLLERCEARRLPVLVHLGFGPPEDVAAVVDACPDLTLILAHAGMPHFERVWRFERVLFDLAGLWGGIGLLPQRLVGRLLQAVGPDRVIYGSDAPSGLRVEGGHRYEFPPVPDQVLGENFTRLIS
ncbi:MAG: amidohydrolase family protein [Acidimicrobiia bacterium]